MNTRPRLLRITTVPISLRILLQGQLRFFREQGFDVLAVSAAGSDVSALEQEGIPHVAVPMTRRITPFADVVSLVKLVLVIRKFRPHIVHSHTPKAGLLGMLAAWLCRVPVRLHTVAGLPLMEASGAKRFVLLLAERLTYACATHVYPNSAGLRDFIAQNIGSRAPVSVIGRGSSNGIDTAFFSRTPALENEAADIRRRHGIREGDIVFSFVGRIVRDKGIPELVAAFRKVLETAGEFRVFLLLVGPFEHELDPLPDGDLEFLQTSRSVVLAGFQPDVRPWIIASDVFVFPSYREGFPNVVMQACALEVPCVVSDINGSNEIVAHGDTGIVVPPKDPVALAAAMNDLARDAHSRQLFARRARDFVTQHFQREYLWRELLREYTRHLGAKRVV